MTTFIEDLLNKKNISFTKENDILLIPSRNLAIKILKLHEHSTLSGKRQHFL